MNESAILQIKIASTHDMVDSYSASAATDADTSAKIALRLQDIALCYPS